MATASASLPSEQQIEEFIRQSNLIENISDPREIVQSRKAWDYLLLQSKLDDDIICTVQGLITFNQPDLSPEEIGAYREIGGKNVVTVNGNHVPVAFMVPFLMGNWLLDYEGLDPKEAHIRFEHIHPFYDGNGRTGRMLMNWQRWKNGMDIMIISASDKEDYYSWFVR